MVHVDRHKAQIEELRKDEPMSPLWHNAVIVPPEWSGARILISCPICGEYQTNKLTIAELDELRRKGSPE